jgi:hypothetical protein
VTDRVYLVSYLSKAGYTLTVALGFGTPWATGENIFSAHSPGCLDRLLPNSRGVRCIPNAKLLWPARFPEIIIEEPRRSWRLGAAN